MVGLKDQPTELSQRLEETFQEWIETLPNQEPFYLPTVLHSGPGTPGRVIVQST